MPVTPQQLTTGANYTIQRYAKNDPIDQFTVAHPLSQWFIKNKQEAMFGNGIFNEKVRISNDSNYQNYTMDDQVSFNTRDTVRLAPFQHYEAHDGFAVNETDLANNGISILDDKSPAVMTGAEEMQIVNIIKEDYAVLKEGFQTNWDLEAHRDGTQSTKAVPGLDTLVSTTPTVGIVGGIDASVSTFWQNNASLAIASTTGVLTTQMEQMWRACMKYGGMAPDYILCGSKFLDAYRQDAPLQVNRQLYMDTGKTGYKVDNGSSGLFFKGVELVWDPQFDVLQTLLAPSTAWDKRCYFLQSKHLILRPNKGRWMINRKPPRVYDRYTYYFGLTADYGITVKKRNSMAVLSIA